MVIDLCPLSVAILDEKINGGFETEQTCHNVATSESNDDSDSCKAIFISKVHLIKIGEKEKEDVVEDTREIPDGYNNVSMRRMVEIDVRD
nr:hypothetical protein [Tanacetum cinerariifolium]